MITPLDRVDARLQELQTKVAAELANIEHGRQFIATVAEAYGSRKLKVSTQAGAPHRMALVRRGGR